MKKLEEENTLGTEELARVEGGTSVVGLAALALAARVDSPVPVPPRRLTGSQLSEALARAGNVSTIPIVTIAPRGHQREACDARPQCEPAPVPEGVAAADTNIVRG